MRPANTERAALERYEQAVLSLPRFARMAFSAGALEHVLPLYEVAFSHPDLREGLDYVWECSFGRAPSGPAVARLQAKLERVIPNLQADKTLKGELGMKVGVGVLEALDLVAGKDAAAIDAACAAFDTMTVAMDLFQGKKPESWIDHLDDLDRVGPEIAEEWRVQNEMLAELATWTDGRHGLAWREQHRARGRRVLEQFTGKGSA